MTRLGLFSYSSLILLLSQALDNKRESRDFPKDGVLTCGQSRRSRPHPSSLNTPTDRDSCNTLFNLETKKKGKMAPITGPSHLVNTLATTAHLETSASQLDGVPKDLEDSIRYETKRLLQASGILLKLPQEVIAQAIVILSRVWSGADGLSLLECDATVSTCPWTGSPFMRL